MVERDGSADAGDGARGPATLSGLRIGLLSPWASRAGGGVFEAVVRQAALIRDLGGEAAVFALDDGHAAADRPRFGNTPVVACRVLGPRQLGCAPDLLRVLLAADLDILHLHGVWMYPSRAGARWAAATRRPYLISPHGMFDRWIVARGRWKKALARRGYERAGWRAAAALHALTAQEADEIALETGRRDALVIPNAAPPPGPPRTTGKGMLYLGRIHSKKNLQALVAAFPESRPAGAVLTIAGWGDPADVAALERSVAGAGGAVRFVGAVHGPAKQRLLNEARWLVLPSFGEGLPMAVLEAWAAGTPTVMTPECNLPNGFAAGAALPCGHTPDAIAAALRQARAMDEPAWRRASAAARALAGGPFSAAAVARAWGEAYRLVAR